jgi:3-methylcrotonyl-CoA carboxylase alpha subunit/geranyl-CoA carboxylase alpha subunit
LLAGLNSMQLLGLPTNRALLAACLDHPAFRAGQALIPFLDEQGAAIRAELRRKEHEAAQGAGLAALFPPTQAHGLACPFPRPLRLRHRGELLAPRVRELADGRLEVESGNAMQTLRPPRASCVRLDDGRWHVQAGAIDLFIEDASFQPANAGGAAGTAGELRAPFNGRVIAVKAAAGANVLQGDTLLVLESMKLEHALAASRAGTIQAVHVEAGQQVATGQVLATFEALP